MKELFEEYVKKSELNKYFGELEVKDIYEDDKNYYAVLKAKEFAYDIPFLVLDKKTNEVKEEQFVDLDNKKMVGKQFAKFSK